MIPVSRLTYESACRLWGEPLAKALCHPAPPGSFWL